MKEKFLKLKEQIMQNKKKAVAVGIAMLLLIGAGGYGIVALNADNREVAKQEQTSKKIKDKKTDKTDAADKKDAIATSGDKKETKKKEDKKEDKKEAAKGNSEKPVDKSNTGSSKPAENTSTGSTGNSNVGNNSSFGGNNEGGSQPEPAPQPIPQPDPEPPAHVCSFDIPIWSEKDETAMVPVWYCNTCGEEVGDPETHLDETMHAGYRNTWEERPTGNKIPYISGYQCSCGAVQ